MTSDKQRTKHQHKDTRLVNTDLNNKVDENAWTYGTQHVHKADSTRTGVVGLYTDCSRLVDLL